MLNVQKILSAIVSFCIFALLLVMFFHPLYALMQDLGLHLKTGEIILNTHHVPKTNLFSYTYPAFPFINHHWLSEVIFFIIYKLSGFNGLLIVAVATAFITFLLIFKAAKKTADIGALAIASILYLGILFERTDVRPEIFSSLFLSIFIVVLYKFREKFTKWIFILPLIELLWVNIHIYFPIGIAVLGLFFLDGLWQNRKKLWCKYTGIFVIVIFLSLLATLINPNFINGAIYPFRVFQNYGYTIEENQNIFFIWNYFHKMTTLYFFIACLILFAVLIVNFKKGKIIDWLIAIFFTAVSISAERNTTLFVFATFIPFAGNLSATLQKLNAERIKKYILIASILFLLLQIGQSIKEKGFGFGTEKGAKNAADFFLRENIKGPLFNNFDIGSYLDYRFYPKIKTFVDARPEAYPKKFFKKTYIPMQENPKIFQKVSEKYKFNSIFFAYTDQTPWAISFLRQIVNNPNWKIVYLDDYAIILLKQNPQNAMFIKKFLITQNSFNINNLNADSFNSLMRVASFLDKAGWINQEVPVYQEILSKNPDFCPALYNLSVILVNQKSPAANIYINLFNSKCK